MPPNTIDFSNVWAKFANLNENAAVFSTVIALIGVYIMLLIWSRYMDKRDIIKVSQPRHTFLFLFCIYFNNIITKFNKIMKKSYRVNCSRN